MVKESVIMPILKQKGIGCSYNRDGLEGYVINCILFKRIAKIRESSNGLIVVEFPMNDLAPFTFKRIDEFTKWLGTNE